MIVIKVACTGFQISEVQEQGSRISLNVNIRAPTVMVPQSSESTNVLLLKLGDLTLRNFFEDEKMESGVTQSWDHIDMNLDSVLLER